MIQDVNEKRMPGTDGPTAGDTGAALIRGREDKRCWLTVHEPGSWELWLNEPTRPAPPRSPESPAEQKGHPEQVLLRGQSPGTFPVPVHPLRRAYCFFRQHGRAASLAETRLPLAGAWNVRDLGGLPTADGRRVAWGRLIRADDLQDLTPEDVAYLASVPLRTVVDFRTPEEWRNAPDILPGGARRVPCTLMPGDIRALAASLAAGEGQGTAGTMVLTDEAQARRVMVQVYRHLVTDAGCLRAWRAFFDLVQDETSLPLLFHCSAGKDRTGVAAALILLGMNVDRHIVMRDYLESQRCLQGKYPGGSPMYGVEPAFLQAALDEVEARYGGAERFLEEVLGVDRRRLRCLFLE